MNSRPLFSPIIRSIPLWILVLGHFFCALFLKDLGRGVAKIDDPAAFAFAQHVLGFYSITSRWVMPPMLLMVLFVQFRLLLNKPAQLGIDILGVLLTWRCGLMFVMLNMLLLSHLKAGGLLLVQLVVFIPIITIDFGWLYWRIDSHARGRGRSHIRFSDEVGSLDPFDYFHIAANTLLQFEPAGAKPTSRLMKSLIVIHGVMMLDIGALTLSRAVSLASGG